MPAPPPKPTFAPLPALIEAFTIPVPALPASLDGFTILHLSDLHIRRFTPGRRSFIELLDALDAAASSALSPRGPPDLIAITGDLMDAPGQEDATRRSLERIAPHLRARLGVVAIFGNHDSPALRRDLDQRPVHPIRFLPGQAVRLRPDLDVLGLSYPEDPLSALLAAPLDPGVFTLTLAHHPTCLIACADLGLPLVLAGHTHAGQVRVSSRLAPHTSSDLPPHLATGLLRLRGTLMPISRGIGTGVIEGLRVNCPPQIPLYTLTPGTPPSPIHTATDPAAAYRTVTQVLPW